MAEDKDAPKQIVTEKGTFNIGPVVGRSKYGCVYQGLHVEGGTFVAIKQVKLASLPEGSDCQDIQNEIELLQSLSHPNVVRYITCKNLSGYFVTVMEYVESGSLLTILNKFGKLPEPLVAMYMSQVMVGLDYLHSEGVTHRGIKAAKLLVTKDGTIKIADAGVSSRVCTLDSLDSPYWMAPESIESNQYTTKSDIWSVGCTTIELLTGKAPYSDLEPSAAMFKLALDPHPQLPNGISDSCKEWLMMIFRRTPKDRSTAGELLSHKWLQDAKQAQEKYKRNLVSIESAQKLVDDVKILRKSVLSQITSYHTTKSPTISQRKQQQQQQQQRPKSPTPPPHTHPQSQSQSQSPQSMLHPTPKQSKRQQLEAELGLTPSSGSGSSSSITACSDNSTPATGSPRNRALSKTKMAPKRAMSSRELDDLLSLAAAGNSSSSGPLSISPRGGGGGNGGNGNGGGGGGGSSGDSSGASGSPALQRRERARNRKVTIGPVKEDANGGSGGDDLRKFTMMQLIERDGGDPSMGKDYAEWLELESVAGNKDALMRENGALLQERVTDIYRKLFAPGIKGTDYFRLLETLIESVNEYAMVKEAALAQAGLGPLVELLLEAPRKPEMMQFYTLKAVNKVVEGSAALMGMLSDCGGIIPVTLFISSSSLDVIDEVITFFEQMSDKNLELFLGCNGVHHILTLLRAVYKIPDYGAGFTVSVLRIVLDTLEAEKGRPHCDVARTYLREGFLTTLIGIGRGLKGNPEAGNLVGASLLAMARADEVIKASMCRAEIITGVWELLNKGTETFRVSLLKAVELIACARENVEMLAREGAVKVLFAQLPKCSDSPSLRKHIFAALKNIVSLDAERQCELVSLGIVPYLCRDVPEPGLKDDVIPLLCSLLKAVKHRDEFKKSNVAEVLIALFADQAYHQKAVESLAWWLEKDSSYVRPKIAHEKIMKALTATITHSNLWAQLMDSVLKMVKKSKTIAQKLGAQEAFVTFVLRKLKKSSTEQIRTLLEIVGVLCRRAKTNSDFVTKNNIVEKLTSLREIHASKVVVASSIDDLIDSIKDKQNEIKQNEVK